MNNSEISDNLNKYVKNQLKADMPRGRGDLFYRYRPDNLGRRLVNGKKHIVFMAYYPYVSAIKKSIALHSTGDFFTTLISCCIREDNEILRWFDQAYEVEHYTDISDLMKDCSVAGVHIHIGPIPFGAVALAATPENNRTIIDVNDLLLFIEKDKNSPACLLERELIKKADGFIHKMPEQAIDDINSQWNLNTPDLLFHSLPYHKLFQDNRVDYTPPYRLVYSGGVIPYHIAKSAGHENHIFDPLIHGICAQDLELSIYANQYAREMFWDEHSRYSDMAKKYPGFEFIPGVPFHELPKAISGFHYGLIYDNYSISSYDPVAYKYNMSTKVFSYLEAGLPVLVYEEMEYIARFVKENGIGVVYSLDRIDQLERLLAQVDYEVLRNNVKDYRDSNHLVARAQELVKLY